MGVNIKTAGGIAIGGIVGFYLINKALNYAYKSVHDITEASKWRAYYRHGQLGRMVPPGYCSHTHVDPLNEQVYEVKSPEQEAEDNAEEEKKKKAEEKQPVDMKPISETIERLAKAYFKTKGIDLDQKDNTEKKDSYHQTYAEYWKKKAKENGTDDTIEAEDIQRAHDAFAAINPEVIEQIDNVYNDITIGTTEETKEDNAMPEDDIE